MMTAVKLFLLLPYFAFIYLAAALFLTIAYTVSLVQRFWGTMHEKKSLPPENIVVLGTGWASYHFLLDLDLTRYNVSLISPRDHFLYTPLLCSASVGTLESHSVIESVDNLGNMVKYIQGKAIDVDFERKMVSFASSFDKATRCIGYDKLVIGVGAVSATNHVVGVDDYAFFVKETADATKIRAKLLKNIMAASCSFMSEVERDEILTSIIVGGGPTGVELAAEIHDFFSNLSHSIFKDITKRFKIVILERNGILARFDYRLCEYAKRLFDSRKHVKIIYTSVSGIHANEVKLQDGTVIKCGLIAWCAGVQQTEFTASLNLPKNDSKQILVTPYLTVTDPKYSDEVFAFGDCCQIDDNRLPLTAQVAFQQGQYLANMFNNIARNKKFPYGTQKPFYFRDLGTMAYLGDFKAVVCLNLFGIALPVTGFPAFIIWRSGYLLRLVSWRQRIQVPIDWLKTVIFGRDLCQF